MENQVIAVAIVIAALGLALALYRQVFMWKKRVAAWQAVAPELGLATAPGTDVAQRFAALAYFNHGHRRLTRVALEGGAGGGAVVLADYQYTTGAGKSQTVHMQTVCVFQASDLALPAFTLRREHGLADRVAQSLGVQDIDFDDDPEFSRAFVLKGDDEAQVRACFHLERRQRLVQLPTSGLHLEGRGDLLLVHTGRLVAPADGRDLLQRSTDVLDIFRR